MEPTKVKATMPMQADALFARFALAPAFIDEGQVANFHANLNGLAKHPKINRFLSPPAKLAEDFWQPEDSYYARYRPYNVINGVLHIPVKGVLLHDFPWQIGSFATGYQYIWKAWERGMSDPGVSAIALLSNTPGGEVAGCFDAVDKMFASKSKPVRAFAHEYAYSAGYAIASVADHIAMSRTGGVGSIGVVMSHVDISGFLEDVGYKITFISAPKGGHKTDGNPYEPLSEEVEARFQKQIDALYDVFVASVVRNRGMDERVVRDTKALTFTADEAVSNGLADSIGSFEDSMAAFAADIENPEGEDPMSKDTDNAAVIEAAKKEAHAKGVTEGHANGLKEGAKAERDRINAILSCDEAKSRQKAALSTALKTDLTVEQAKSLLTDLAEEKAEASNDNGQNFNQAMSEDNPNLGAGNEDETGGAEAGGELARKFGLAGF